MDATIDPPSERVCERCGREDRWDAQRENWAIADDVGDPNCIHEWDINGSYTPVDTDA